MKSLISGSWVGGCHGYAHAILRLAVGIVFIVHGWQKFSGGVDGVAGFLGSLGFPIASTFAVILIAVELLGGVALVLGVLTYWVAGLLAIDMLVALFAVHIGKGFFISNGGYEFVLVLLAATISLMLTGSGKCSLGKG